VNQKNSVHEETQKNSAPEEEKDAESRTEKKEEEVLYDSAPSMFRNRPFLFTISVLAVVGGLIGLIAWKANESSGSAFLSILAMLCGFIGLINLFFWWLKVINTRLTATNERVTLKIGILDKNIREVFLSDIRSVQINQRLLQRILRTGHVEISSAASSDAEIEIDGIPNAYKVKEIIDQNRRKTRRVRIPDE
jgi:uncharacterized membrane protein YdbT with pleckstrin-like domain